MKANLGRWIRICFALIFLVFTQGATAALSHNPDFEWKTIHTPNFRVHFHDGLHSHASHVAKLAEDVHLRLSEHLSWVPKNPTDIVLMDEIDFANGYATPFPSNRIVLWLTPPEHGLADYGPWLETLITHEYVHTLHLDKSRGLPARLQKFFGRHPLLFPNVFQPLWLIEGLATHIETDVERGLGRGQSSYFDMLMRREVLNGLKPLSQVNQSFASWPTGTSSYLYGVEFYKFLVKRFGEEEVKRFVEIYSDNIIPFVVNGTFKQVFGADAKQLWREFKLDLEAKYAQQQKAVEQTGIVEGKRLSQHGYMTTESSLTPQGDLIYLRNDGESQAGLFIKSKDNLFEDQRLLDLNGMASIDVNDQGVVVIAQPERFDNANVFYDLYTYDLNTGTMTRLTQAKRYRYASWGPEGKQMLAVRFSKGQYAMDLLNDKGGRLEKVWQGKEGEIVSHIDWSPSGQSVVATVWREGHGWNLEQFLLEQGKWEPLTQDQAIQLHPRFTAQGDGVFFSADYNGIYNLYRMELATKKLSQLSNVLDGAFYPLPSSDGQVFYTGYNAQGYDVYHLEQAAALPIQVNVIAGPSYVAQAIGNDGEQAFLVKDYQPYEALFPTWWSPILGVDQNTVMLGASTSGSDPLMRHNYTLSLGLDSESRSWFGGLAYRYDRLLPVLNLFMSRMISRDTDSSGTLRRTRETDFVQIGADLPVMKLQNQWALHTAIYLDKEHDGYRAKGVDKQAQQNDSLLGWGFSYNSTRRYPLSVSKSDGRQISLKLEDRNMFGSDYTGDAVIFDWREYFVLGSEHVLAVRGLVGEADIGSKRFDLGGSDSDDLFPISPNNIGMLFNQRSYPLRGYPEGLPELRGRKARLYSAEWRFPIKRIERGIMAPPMAIDQLSGALFYDAGRAWEGPDKGALRSGMGVELYGDSHLFYRVPLRFRLGYAYGKDEGGESQFYLRLGSAF